VNGSSEKNQKNADSISWPKDDVLHQRLDKIIECVEQGSWNPDPEKKKISVRDDLTEPSPTKKIDDDENPKSISSDNLPKNLSEDSENSSSQPLNLEIISSAESEIKKRYQRSLKNLILI